MKEAVKRTHFPRYDHSEVIWWPAKKRSIIMAAGSRNRLSAGVLNGGDLLSDSTWNFDQ